MLVVEYLNESLEFCNVFKDFLIWGYGIDWLIVFSFCVNLFIENIIVYWIFDLKLIFIILFLEVKWIRVCLIFFFWLDG